ncbi:acetolactate synthase large subunit [Oenococcus oeni]|uniref:acetolactate synthase large subunit n=1 Tax=Oenococcus oeni TaxID=1247 RepID=UPI00050F04A7|nr:acetolactate synthase large subunit [Oenococcus oeni]KGI02709.1 acetolactate synthase [Oenococcus oeni IOEB_C52]SYV99135.1 acetolactate synthase I, large subunit [Oenococcus oeni]
MDTAHQIVKVLEDRDVKYVFGIPGEENIHLVDAINQSDKIKFILVRHEQGASFMAGVYGRLTGKPGVAAATLGPGAINLLLGVADSKTNSTPMIAITAQGGLDRIYKESHQVIDLKAMFQPITKWSTHIYEAKTTSEIIGKAYDKAVNGRPGPVYIGVPQDVEEQETGSQISTLSMPKESNEPNPKLIEKAARLIKNAKHPVVMAGMGIVRNHAEKELNAFIEKTHLPVATTFMGKGSVDDRSKYALGVIGFMAHDYENFAFDQADLILSIGYELSEFNPVRINPKANKTIIHMSTFSEDSDEHYPVKVNIISDIDKSIRALSDCLNDFKSSETKADIREEVEAEIASGKVESKVPLTPQQIISATRESVDDKGIVLVDTGALKMWMARLYPTYAPNTCLIDNGLSTMSWSLPGAIGAKLAKPDHHILSVMGDGSFMMNSQELETAVRYHIPITILLWVDKSYGLIKWKMDMEMGHHSEVDFDNPDFVEYVESFGANAHIVSSRNDLKNKLQNYLKNDNQVNVLICPVDYRENMKLINKLGKVTVSL